MCSSWPHPPAAGLQAHLWAAEAPPSSSWQLQPPAGDCRGSGCQPWERGNFLPPCLSWAAGGGAATLCPLQRGSCQVAQREKEELFP